MRYNERHDLEDPDALVFVRVNPGDNSYARGDAGAIMSNSQVLDGLPIYDD